MSFTYPRQTPLSVAVSLALLLASGVISAGADTASETPDRPAETPDAIDLPRIRVVAPDLLKLALTPGSVYTLTQEEVEQIQPRSTEDLLRRVPGIYIKREEDSAVVTNIGVRGLPAGDYKTLVLEDGVPIQPGIFVGNSRYFNPRVQRMEGAEVLKGASSLRFGPNNIGGVINFLTRTPEDGVALTAQWGTWNTREAMLDVGATSASREARFGLIATHAASDGWNDKGWDMSDVMVKAGSAVGEGHFVGLKFSYYENTANISYRGYFPDAYAAGATFNPAPDDFFLTDRTAFDLNHEWDINRNLRLQTVFFWSEMRRDYWRFGVNGATTHAEGFSVWNYTDTVQGNNRSFERQGFDSRLTLQHFTLGFDNEAQFGLRYFQEDMLDVTVSAARATPRSPVGAPSRNRIDRGDSLAWFAQNRFDISQALAVTAGVRVERYEQTRKDLRRAVDAVQSYRNTEWLPGIGATYQINPAIQVYGSVYVAFAPPLVGSVVGAGDVPTAAEKSVNLDLGLRGSYGAFNYEIAAFQMDFSNQVDPGISNIRAPNEGSALIRGVELALGYDLGGGFQVNGNLSWIPTAEFGEDRPGEALAGNRLPDSPEWTANLGLSYQSGGLRTALLWNYTDQVFGDGMNRITIDPLRHMGGLIPGYATLDWTASYEVSSRLRVFGAIRNLADKRYIAGLRQGIYAGPERSVDLGLRYRF